MTFEKLTRAKKKKFYADLMSALNDKINYEKLGNVTMECDACGQSRKITDWVDVPGNDIKEPTPTICKQCYWVNRRKPDWTLPTQDKVFINRLGVFVSTLEKECKRARTKVTS